MVRAIHVVTSAGFRTASHQGFPDMARLPRVSLYFEFHPLLVYARRCSAPHGVYNGVAKSWRVPAAEAEAFAVQANNLMRNAGLTACAWIGGRRVNLGVQPQAIPATADAPALEPAI